MTHRRPSQTSSSVHCPSEVQAKRHTPASQRSPCRHCDPSIVQAGRHRSSSHLQPVAQSVCMRHVIAGLRTQAIFGVGLAISPSGQEHIAFRSTTEHRAFGPHGLFSAAQGFWQTLFLHSSSGPQSSSCLHPYWQLFPRQM